MGKSPHDVIIAKCRLRLSNLVTPNRNINHIIPTHTTCEDCVDADQAKLFINSY